MVYERQSTNKSSLSLGFQEKTAELFFLIFNVKSI